MNSSPETARVWERGAVPAAVLLGSVFGFLALPDPVLADSLTFRLKERILSWPQLFDPAYTELINPYYRPLFIVLHGLFDRVLGLGDFGLRLLSLSCHLAALTSLARLGRSLGLSVRPRATAVLLFGLAPGNVFTVAWPVVGYWMLAAALTFLSLSFFVDGRMSGRPRDFALGLLFAGLGLLSSQTPYSLVALLPALALFAPRESGTPRAGSVRWSIVSWLALSLVAWLHFRVLETGAQGLATARDPGALIAKLLHTVPPYWQGALGGNAVGGWWPAAALFGAITLIGTLGLRRRGALLACLALLSPLPFAAIGHSDRYAYFASGAMLLWFTDAAWHGLPALAKRRRGPSAARRTRFVGVAAVVGLTALSTVQSVVRFAMVRDNARLTGDLHDDLRSFADELQDLDRVAFVNLPPMMKWHVFDVLEVDTEEEFQRRFDQFHNHAFFTTDHAFFHFAPYDQSADYDVVLECDGRRLHRREPTRPLGDRRPIAPPWFLAESYEVVETEEHGGRTALATLDRVLARTRQIEEPHRHVVLERAPPTLRAPLPTEGASFRYEPEELQLSAQEARTGGVRFPGRLVVDLDLARPGLVVVITWFGAEDPVHRVAGDVGRMCRHIEAILDGEPVAIEPVFFHCTGVVVPPGPHQLVLRWRLGPAPSALGGSEE